MKKVIIIVLSLFILSKNTLKADLKAVQKDDIKLLEGVTRAKLEAIQAKSKELTKETELKKITDELENKKSEAKDIKQKEKLLRDQFNDARIKGNVKVLNQFKQIKEKSKKLKDEVQEKVNEVLKVKDEVKKSKITLDLTEKQANEEIQKKSEELKEKRKELMIEAANVESEFHTNILNTSPVMQEKAKELLAQYDRLKTQLEVYNQAEMYIAAQKATISVEQEKALLDAYIKAINNLKSKQEVETEAKKATQNAKLTAAPYIIKLSDTAQLNLKNIEPFSKKSFEELLNERIKENLPLIISQIVTAGSGSEFMDAFEMSKEMFFYDNLPFDINETTTYQNKPIKNIVYYKIKAPSSNQVISFEINEFENGHVVNNNYDQLANFFKNLSQKELLDILEHVEDMLTRPDMDFAHLEPAERKLINLAIEVLKNGNLPLAKKVSEIKHFNSFHIRSYNFTNLIVDILIKEDFDSQKKYQELQVIFDQIMSEASLYEKDKFLNYFYKKGNLWQAERLYESLMKNPQTSVDQKVFVMLNYANTILEGNEKTKSNEIRAFEMYKQIMDNPQLASQLNDYERTQINFKLGLAYENGIETTNKVESSVSKNIAAAIKIFSDIVQNPLPLSLKPYQRADLDLIKIEAALELGKIYVNELPLNSANINKARELFEGIIKSKTALQQIKNTTLKYITKLNERIKNEMHGVENISIREKDKDESKEELETKYQETKVKEDKKEEIKLEEKLDGKEEKKRRSPSPKFKVTIHPYKTPINLSPKSGQSLTNDLD